MSYLAIWLRACLHWRCAYFQTLSWNDTIFVVDWDILYKLCGSANKWSKGFVFSGKIWWQFFSCNKACSKYRTRSTTTPKYTLTQRLVRVKMPGGRAFWNVGAGHPSISHAHTPAQILQNACPLCFSLAQGNLFAILTMSSVSAIDFCDNRSNRQLFRRSCFMALLRYSSWVIWEPKMCVLKSPTSYVISNTSKIEYFDHFFMVR